MVFLPLIYSNLTVLCYSVSSYSFSYYCRFLRLFVVIVLRSVETDGLALHLRCQFVTINVTLFITHFITHLIVHLRVGNGFAMPPYKCALMVDDMGTNVLNLLIVVIDK